MKKYNKLLIILGISLSMLIPTQIIYARGGHASSHISSHSSFSHSSFSSHNSSGHSSSGSFKSGSFSSAKPKAKENKSKTQSIKTKKAAKTTITPKSKSSNKNIVVNKKYYNTTFRYPTYHTYFVPSFYNPYYHDNIWTHYWMYQAIANHNMNSNTVVMQGHKASYSIWQDIITLFILIIIIFGIYKLIKYFIDKRDDR